MADDNNEFDEESIENLFDNNDSEASDYLDEQQIDENADYNPANINDSFGRQEFAKRAKNNNYYKEEAAKLKQKQLDAKESKDKAREEKNKNLKQTSDKSNPTNKSVKDKINDNKNLGKANMDVAKSKVAGVNNKINDLKSKAYMMQNPLEAGKTFFAEKMKAGLLKAVVTNPYIIIISAVIITVLLLIFFLLIINIDDSSNNAASTYYSSGTGFWWPVGGEEVTGSSSTGYFAVDEPMSTIITAPYLEERTKDSGEIYYHSGIDIGNNGYAYYDESTGRYSSDIPIIASKDGTITLIVENTGDTSYGNYVIIDHGDEITTLYAHLDRFVDIEIGDTVSQGQVIGYMGTTGNSTGVHLHFEVRVNGEHVDPLNYIDADNPRESFEYSYILGISLTSTSLSKSEFSSKLSTYCSRISNTNCTTNFANNSSLIYDTALAAGINPEIVVAYAQIEYQFACTNYNCWALGHGNTSSSGSSYSSFEDGIEAFAEYILKYNDTSNSYYSAIEQMATEAADSGCLSAGYIYPNTLVWVQSKYSSFGSYLYNPGSSGLGGCYFIEYWGTIGFLNYTEDYYNSRCSTSTYCTSGASESTCTSPTVCETNDYSVYTAKTRADIIMTIFYSD